MKLRSLSYKGKGRPRNDDYKEVNKRYLEQEINADAISVGFKKLGEFYAKSNKKVAN